ncbi:MAG TPA: extracellular solute-binding protein, partial [Rhodobacterales bacterium]|nr:extracellular solute-binding protein [Rhodobacterales bacterium]
LQFATNNNGFDGADGTKIVIDEPNIKMMFSKLKEWLDEGYFGYYGTGWGDNQSAFEKQEVAMWLGSSGSFGGLSKSADFEFSATFLPYWSSITEEPYQTFIGGAALFAMSGKSAEENKATAAFFKFLSSPEIQLMWHKETGYVPITQAAYELAKTQGYYDEKPAAEIGILQLAGTEGEWTKGYRMGYYVQIRDVMNREYGKILSGDESVDAAFATIQAESDKLLDRFAATQK